MPDPDRPLSPAVRKALDEMNSFEREVARLKQLTADSKLPTTPSPPTNRAVVRNNIASAIVRLEAAHRVAVKADMMDTAYAVSYAIDCLRVAYKDALRDDGKGASDPHEAPLSFTSGPPTGS